jgi:hypothetical protein
MRSRQTKSGRAAGGWGTDDSWERIPDQGRIAFAWLVTVAVGTANLLFLARLLDGLAK